MLTAVILAGGEGKRMGQGGLPKPLCSFRGRPMVDWVIEAARGAGAERIIVVVGYRADLVRTYLEEAHFGLEFALQEEQLGTAHALKMALPLLGAQSTTSARLGAQSTTSARLGAQSTTSALLEGNEGQVLVLCADHPAIPVSVLRDFCQAETGAEVSAKVLTLVLEDPTGYGRILRAPDGSFLGTIEERDIVESEYRGGRSSKSEYRMVREVSSGILMFSAPLLHTLLPLVDNQNAQGEYYLPDLLKMIPREQILIFQAPSGLPFLGVNTPADMERLNEAVENDDISN